MSTTRKADSDGFPEAERVAMKERAKAGLFCDCRVTPAVEKKVVALIGAAVP